MHLFYSESISGDHLVLSADEAQHAIKVMRLRIGDALHATDGKGNIFKGEILSLDARELAVRVETIDSSIPECSRLHIAIAPTKNTDRLEWFLEKATEFGVGEITPVICDRSERKELRTDRLQRILITAMKQSLRPWLPVLNDPVPLKKFLERTIAGDKYIAHCAENEKKSFFREIDVKKNTLVLVGPEGDFSPAEISLATDKGFIPVSLGNSRLRTETAGIAVAHMFAIALEK